MNNPCSQPTEIHILRFIFRAIFRKIKTVYYICVSGIAQPFNLWAEFNPLGHTSVHRNQSSVEGKTVKILLTNAKAPLVISILLKY